MVNMVGIDLRRGIGVVTMQFLLLLILSVLVIASFKLKMGLWHRDPNFMPLELSYPHPILFIESIDGFTMVTDKKGGTYPLSMYSLVICENIFLLVVLLLGLIKYQLLLP